MMMVDSTPSEQSSPSECLSDCEHSSPSECLSDSKQSSSSASNQKQSNLQQVLSIVETHAEVGTRHAFEVCMKALCTLDARFYIQYPELRHSVVHRLISLSQTFDLSAFQTVVQFADKMIADVYFTEDFEDCESDLEQYDFLVSIATNK